MKSAFSVIVPVYNEALLLAESTDAMVDRLRGLGRPFEILLCENGSTDESRAIARALEQRHDEVRVETLEVADYGIALRHAIGAVRHEDVVIVNADFWSAEFADEALTGLERADLVLGSKVMKGATDQRPLIRRAITRGFNAFLRLVFGFTGTDTHGMKALRRDAALPLAQSCVTAGFLFDTELVLRFERAGYRIVEVPVDTREVRPPRRGAVLQRIPRVVLGLLKLAVAFQREGRPAPRVETELVGR